MSEGFLSWKRAILWPHFNVGLRKGKFGNWAFFFLLLLLFLDVVDGFTTGSWVRILTLLLFYLVCGLLIWLAVITARWWIRFTGIHPKIAKVVRIFILITAWEPKVLLEGSGASEGLRAWAEMLIAGGMVLYIAIRMEYLTLHSAMPFYILIDLASFITGAYLARNELRKPI
jgi:hypothetical protein